MKSFSHRGLVLPLIAPYAVASGAPFKVGALVTVAVAAAAQGAAVEGMTEGVFKLPKVGAQAWAVGDKIYWDDTAKLMTTTAASNTLVGAATVAAANPSTTGTVYLDGAVR
jgi:predicted RecA/RadA family phage recombinase